MEALLLLMALIAFGVAAVLAFIQRAHAVGLIAAGLFLWVLVALLPHFTTIH